MAINKVSPNDPVAPNSVTKVSSSDPAVPNSVSKVSAASPAVPNSVTAVTAAGSPRVLCPKLGLDFASGLYSVCGSPKTFADLLTYTRASNATFINRRFDACGNLEYFLDTDFVGSVTNLVTRSEEFDHADWTKNNTSVTANAVNGPFATSGKTADKVTDDATNATHTVDSADISITSGNNYTASFYVKNVSIDVVRVDFSGFANWVGDPFAAFDIENGILLQTGSADIAASIDYVGDGWYRISMTAKASATTTSKAKLVMTNGTATGTTYVGTGESVYVWGAQATESLKQQPYVKTTSASASDTFTESLRIEYDPATGENLGALIEGSSTNLAIRSEEFDNASWTKSNSTVTANNAIAPDLTKSADKFAAGSTGSIIPTVDQSVTTVATNEYTTSYFVKRSEVRYVQIHYSTGHVTGDPRANFDLINGTLETVDAEITATIKNMGDGWYRISSTVTAAGTALNSKLRLALSSTIGRTASESHTSGNGVFVWGAQVEQKPFATSYIRTEGATVARSADNLEASPAHMPLFENEWASFLKFDVNGLPTTNAYLFDSGTTGSVSRNARITSSGTTVAIDSTSSTTVISDVIVAGAETEHGITRANANSITQWYLNGVAKGSVTRTGSSSDQWTDLQIGSATSNTQYLDGHIKQFKIFDLALTAQEVALL